MAPTIFIVPGIWETPSVWDKLVSILTTTYNLPVTVTQLISTGKTSADAPRINDDIAHIKSEFTTAVEAAGPDGIIAVLHSAGGFLGSSAMEGLTAKALKEQGKQGGVQKIVFVTGAVAPEGLIHDPKPFMKIEGNKMTCVDFRSLFFNDLSDEDAERWISTCQPAPACWNGQATTYCGWREVPSAYIICEKDCTIPMAYQEKMAELAGSKPIVRVQTGHMPQLTIPEKIAEVVNDVASEKV